MSASIPPRRKGQRPHPKLPLSAFSPPNSATNESFPVPSSPSVVHPKAIIDANVIARDGDTSLTQWKKEAGGILGERISGVVLSLPGVEVERAMSQLQTSQGNVPVLSLIVPLALENKEQPLHPFPPNPILPLSFGTIYTQSTPEGVASLRWALEHGRPVDIDMEATLSDAMVESFTDFIYKATENLVKIPPIVLSNVLPPPHDLEQPIVKLMNHPTYLAFQSQTAALSLLPNVYVKYLPPSWNAPTPPTPSVGTTEKDETSKQKKEWKRRIKMYLGPVLEAFGHQRIIFGTSPCPSSMGTSVANDWYELAKEALAELGVEQEFVDAIFHNNAKVVYGMN